MPEERSSYLGSLYDQSRFANARAFGPNVFGEFRNWGYWCADTENQQEACENLADLVIGMLPRHTGTILDVGCGLGAVARCLTAHYPATAITGINIMDEQLDTCRRIVPGASFVNMSATAMTFPDASFDRAVCVEAAMHFATREQFLRETFRVLKPGGYLAIADIIGFPVEHPANRLDSLADYQTLLRAIGFVEARVVDITEDASWSHADYMLWYLQDKLQRKELTQAQYELGVAGRFARLVAGRYYLVACARKPPEVLPPWRGAGKERHAVRELQRLLVETAKL